MRVQDPLPVRGFSRHLRLLQMSQVCAASGVERTDRENSYIPSAQSAEQNTRRMSRSEMGRLEEVHPEL